MYKFIFFCSQRFLGGIFRDRLKYCIFLSFEDSSINSGVWGS